MDGLPRGLTGALALDALVRRYGEQSTDKARSRAVRQHEKAVARRELLLVRARRARPLQSGLAVAGALLLALTEGGDPVWATLAVLCAVRAGHAVLVLRHPPPLPVPPTALTAPPSVPPTSAAEPAVRRLDRTREQLARLAPLVGPGGQDAAVEALGAAADADTALRWQAARLAAVEPYRGPDRHLLPALLAGVACQEQLVTAFADLVAASDPRTPTTAASLQDATDRLHGLADGLRELG